jgi:hypothetical protein
MWAFIAIIAFSIFFTSCKSKAGNIHVEDSESHSKKQAESFDEFNQKFHSDSAFQLSRIVFPLSGETKDGWKSIEWTAKNWELHKEPVKKEFQSSEFRHKYLRTDTSVFEKYWIDSSGVLIERKFLLKEGKWYLLYYTDLNL